jgi:hypothetical protein
MGMTPRCTRLVGLLLATLGPGCGSSAGNPYSLPVGADDGGRGGFFGGDASTASALDAHVEENRITVTVITLGCKGACANVEAVATGGQPPYTFVWDDGSTSASRQVCPTSNASYYVKVTDTGTAGELSRPAETVELPLAASVIGCGDGGVGACDDGEVTAVPIPGRYVGSLYCQPDGGVASFPSLDGGEPTSGTITIDLTTSVSGSFYFLWFTDVIGVTGSFRGAPDCSKRGLVATWESGEWGLPQTASDGGMTVSNTGTDNGTLTAIPASDSPDTITGTFDYVVSTGFCQGTYTATRQP